MLNINFRRTKLNKLKRLVLISKIKTFENKFHENFQKFFEISRGKLFFCLFLKNLRYKSVFYWQCKFFGIKIYPNLMSDSFGLADVFAFFVKH